MVCFFKHLMCVRVKAISKMTLAKKVDNNQKEIYAALRQVYATVIDLSGVGKGIPDSLII